MTGDLGGRREALVARDQLSLGEVRFGAVAVSNSELRVGTTRNTSLYATNCIQVGHEPRYV